MNVKTKTLIFIALPVILLGAIIAIYYMKDSGGIKNASSDYKLSSTALNKEFLVNDSVANATYGNKIIELTGVVAGIRSSEAHGLIITFDDPMMGIKCVMDSTIKSIPTGISEGNIITVKGVCIGSDQLIGVMMNQCIITKKDKSSNL